MSRQIQCHTKVSSLTPYTIAKSRGQCTTVTARERLREGLRDYLVRRYSKNRKGN